jgi:hypothetical protein
MLLPECRNQLAGRRSDVRARLRYRSPQGHLPLVQIGSFGSGSIVPVALSEPNTGLRQPHEQTAWIAPRAI